MRCGAAGQVDLTTRWRDGTTHLVMSPLEFMQRLAALMPRPLLHLIRLNGVLANAKLRTLVVPQGPGWREEAIEAATNSRLRLCRAVRAGPHRLGEAARARV